MHAHGLISTYHVATFGDSRLINGTEIDIVAQTRDVAPDQDIALYAPVSLNGAGQIVKAVAGTPAIGVSDFPVQTGPAETKPCTVLRAGVFDPFTIAYDESYATLAQKLSAFEGAPSPTNIHVKLSLPA